MEDSLAPGGIPTGITTPVNVYGIDISAYQGNEIDTLDKVKSNLGFVICKATEGLTFTDKMFSHNWQKIQEKGFVRGAYHFYHSQHDPVKQADFFLQTVKGFLPTDLPPVIDFEEQSIAAGAVKKDVQTKLLAFLQYIQTKTGRLPMLYTDPNVGNGYLDDPAFAKYPLYLAYYNAAAPAKLPGAWKGKNWTIWQKSGNYLIGKTNNDFDVFNGNMAALTAFIKSSIITV